MEKAKVEEILEWVVLALIVSVATLVLLWVGGWLLLGLGKLFLWLAGVLAQLLYFLVPALVVAGAVYLVVRWLEGRRRTAS